MQLRKIRIMWYPSLVVKVKIMIKFSEDVDLSNDAFLIYHYKTDTIRYINSQLIKDFNIYKERILYKLSNY